jgi:hypothetical protein
LQHEHDLTVIVAADLVDGFERRQVFFLVMADPSWMTCPFDNARGAPCREMPAG